MSGWYRYGDPGEDTVAHINTGVGRSSEKCAMPKFDKDDPQPGPKCARLSIALCDAPGCDKPICALHRTMHDWKDNTDYCPDHKEMAHEPRKS